MSSDPHIQDRTLPSNSSLQDVHLDFNCSSLSDSIYNILYNTYIKRFPIFEQFHR